MYTNSTSSSIQSRANTPIGDPSAVSLLCLMHLLTQLPVMRSRDKYSLPDQPNLAVMRERREQRKINLSVLKRIHAVERPDFTKLESVEAFETPKLVTRDKKGQVKGINFLGMTCDKNSWHVGPPGAEAAPVRKEKSQTAIDISPEEFEQRYSRNFEFWMSPSAIAEKNLKGVLVVIGEDHFDEAIDEAITEVIVPFGKSRSYRFFLEGCSEEGLLERRLIYQLEAEHSEMLEIGSKVCEELTKLVLEKNKKFRACITLMKKHIPSMRSERVADNVLAYRKVMGRYLDALPAVAQKEFTKLAKEALAVVDICDRRSAETLDERNHLMADMLRKRRDRSKVNVAVIGAEHAKGMREQMKDLPCIFMMPHQLIAIRPKFSLKDNSKQEL